MHKYDLSSGLHGDILGYIVPVGAAFQPLAISCDSWDEQTKPHTLGRAGGERYLDLTLFLT